MNVSWKGQTIRVFWQESVKLKRRPERSNPFLKSLGGFYATGTVLSYLGMKGEVCQMLQKLCHESRAYVVEQEGLPFFLVQKLHAVGWLKHLKAEGTLQDQSVIRDIEFPEDLINILIAYEGVESFEY